MKSLLNDLLSNELSYEQLIKKSGKFVFSDFLSAISGRRSESASNNIDFRFDFNTEFFLDAVLNFFHEF